MSWTDAAIWTQAIATTALAGLICFVHFVHYPMLANVGSREFTRYMDSHVKRTTAVVAPLMLAEVAAAVFLLQALDHEPRSWVAFSLLLVVWLSTALLQVPCHRKLERGKNAAVIRRLVATNWLRVLGWGARVPIVLALLAGRGQS